MKDLLSISAASLQRAIGIKRKIERLEAQLHALAGGKATAATVAPRKRWTMSPEARRKIATAQKARWAKFHAQKK
jgi:hypothetical protein